ncbi:MAG: amidohydrolase family protein, partial [Acidobacteriota bacterium]|nr:amidohydrolase family protein [Acidobacteriota bacterium]
MFDIAFIAPRAVVDGGERACAIGVHDGRIAAIEPVDAELPARETVRLTDTEVLLPGLVDTHVHVNEPGRTEWEGFETATRAAAAGGVTTLVDMPLNSIPATTARDALEAKRASARDQIYVDVGFWGGAVPGNVGELAALHEAGVLGFKAFMAETGVDDFPRVTDGVLLAGLREAARLDTLVLVHAENEEIAQYYTGRLLAQGRRDPLAWAEGRPPVVEVEAIR